MSEKAASGRQSPAARRERLAAQLRANLKKRKAQARARACADTAAEAAGVVDLDADREH